MRGACAVWVQRVTLLAVVAAGCSGTLDTGDGGGDLASAGDPGDGGGPSGDGPGGGDGAGGGDGGGRPDGIGPGADGPSPGDGPGPGLDLPVPDGGATAGQSPVVGGCAIFPDGDDWNLDVSAAAPDADWTGRLQTFVGGVNLHPDFGGAEYGIPINVVPQDQPALDVAFDGYPEESDPPPYPFPAPDMAAIEGGVPTACDGDCHLLALQQGTCKLFEGYACQYSDQWHCSNGAVWDLTQGSYGQRPRGWTSVDAAGLSVTAGLLRLDEVTAGEVRHAIRFTTRCTIDRFVRPATHQAVPRDCDPNDPDAPPMGLRVRLMDSFDESPYSAPTRVVLAAMKRHGMILADNGSDFFFQGERNAGWPDTLIEELKQIPSGAFEAVLVGPLEQ